MAIDSKAKRFSMMNFGKRFIVLPPPTGTVDAAARATLLGMYSGISKAVSAVTASLQNAISFSKRHGYRKNRT